MVNLTSFLMIYTFIMLSLIIKELEAIEISTLKSLWCILKTGSTVPIKELILRDEKFFKRLSCSFQMYM